MTWQISQVSHLNWTDGEAACLGNFPGCSPGVWALCQSDYSYTTKWDMARRRPQCWHTIIWTTKLLWALNHLLPVCFLVVVAAWQCPQVIPCHPYLIPLYPHTPSHFSLVVCHHQLPVLPTFLFPAAISPLGRSWSFGGGWSSSKPWWVNSERSLGLFWSRSICISQKCFSGFRLAKDCSS